jgi:large-conductance mechanosensitive channel
LFSLPYVLVDNKVAGSYFNAKCLNSKTHSKKKEIIAEPVPTGPTEIELLAQIRDALGK